MLLVLTEEHKKHLSFLATVDISVVREFCRISLDFIRKGPNPRLYSSAAQKLNVDVQSIRHGVEGLMYLLVESSKLKVNEIDFIDSIVILGYDDDLNKELLSLYQEHCTEIRSILDGMSMDIPHYHDLEWRVDMQLDGRSLQRQSQPSVILRLHTLDEGVPSCETIETDPVNLMHLTKSLDAALSELKSQHCRKIMKNIK